MTKSGNWKISDAKVFADVSDENSAYFKSDKLEGFD